jgi:hypothetical protein
LGGAPDSNQPVNAVESGSAAAAAGLTKVGRDAEIEAPAKYVETRGLPCKILASLPQTVHQ